MGYQMQRICRLTQYINSRKWPHFIAWGGKSSMKPKAAPCVNPEALMISTRTVGTNFRKEKN